MKIAHEIMTRDPICVRSETKVGDAIKILLEHRFNGLPVVDADNNVVGILTQGDLIAKQRSVDIPSYFVLFDATIPLSSPRKFEENLEKLNATTVSDLMSTEVFYADANTPVDEIAGYMTDYKHYTIPVLEEGKLVGVIGKEDILKLIIS